jgi:hypothetical protein
LFFHINLFSLFSNTAITLRPHPSYPFSKREGTVLHIIIVHLFFHIFLFVL